MLSKSFLDVRILHFGKICLWNPQIRRQFYNNIQYLFFFNVLIT